MTEHVLDQTHESHGELVVIARNTAAADAGTIHDDATAQQHGYRGGLVTGVTLIGYITRALMERFGERWIESGELSVRFARPVYNGERTRVHVLQRTRRDECQTVGVELRTGAGTACAEGTACCAAIRSNRQHSPWRRLIPVTPPLRDAAHPPLDYESIVVGEELRPLHLRPSVEECARFADDLDDPSKWYRDGSPRETPIVHPAWFARLPILLWRNTFANKATVHASTEIAYCGPAEAGKEFITYGYVADKFERNRQGYMVLDTMTVDEDGREIARDRHTSVIRLRGEP